MLDWKSLESESFTFATVDKKAAELVLNGGSDLKEAALVAYLIASARAGYASIEIKDDSVTPALSQDETLLRHVIEGSKTLLMEDKPLIKVENSYYLQRNFSLEQTCLQEWERLKRSKPLHTLNESIFEQELTLHDSLTIEQKNAVETGCRSLVFILTGGPGTGKTYTAGRLLGTLLKSLNSSCEIALAAPTGKAALTLEKALGSYLPGGLAKAKTLHALLGVRKDGSYPERRTMLPYDIILVDEASMIDIELMSHLLASIKSGARLILMGDPSQLPPVEGAPIFPTLAQTHQAKSQLTKCLRAETKELVSFAESILKGQPFQESESIQFIDPKESLESVLLSHLNRFPKNLPLDATPDEWLAAFQKFRILTPLKVGPAGSVAINRFVAKHLQERAIPLMITSNDYRMDLFNGEIGILITEGREIPEFFGENDYVFFASGKKIPALLLPSYELAYAMTVHKSQGSEFDEVLLLLPETATPVSIPLLYTAVTRARKKITLWGKRLV
jgi:exodeoxyribonuclease V alpha subunit